MRYELREGAVFVSKIKHRRIVGLIGPRVVYSTGAHKNRDCLVATFRRWVTRSKAMISYMPNDINI